MRVVSKRALVKFYTTQSSYFDATSQMNEWYNYVRKSNWQTPHEIKASLRNASILKNNRVVFNLCGNKYRIVVRIDYKFQIVFIRFVGTHQQYDQIIDIENI